MDQKAGSQQERRKQILFRNKVLRKAFSLTLGNKIKIWKFKHNEEIRQLCKDPDLAVQVRSHGLRWTGHIFREEDNSTVKNIFKTATGRRRPTGKIREKMVGPSSEGYEGMLRTKSVGDGVLLRPRTPTGVQMATMALSK